MNIEQVAAAEAAGEAEFASAFADATKETATPAPADAAQVDDDTLLLDADSDLNSSDDAGDKPAAVADAAPAAPAAGTQTAGRAAAPPVDDLEQRLANTDPLVVAALKAAQQASKSDRGRIAAYQRQIDELKATTRTPPPADTVTGTSADMADLLNDPALIEATEAYGDVLNPVLTVMKAMQAEISTLRGTVTADQSARAERAAAAVIEAEEVAVREKHDDLDAIIASQAFADWAGANPHVMPTIERNGAKIVDAIAVNGLLDQFKREAKWTSPSPAPGAKPGNPNDARRQRQITASVQTPTGGMGAVSSKGTDSFDDAFAEASAKTTL